GGTVVILELGAPLKGLMAPFARFHVRHVVPWIGALLSGDAEYRYLQKSVAAFPAPEAFCDLMRDAGLKDVGFQAMPFDAAHLYVGHA
ncbi:MAG: class I SAM-dependent methyltransferase, partial [Myxococcales bacterium]|nr:class I SAM-dependent methyltransferase [Myxococcales bacterium]